MPESNFVVAGNNQPPRSIENEYDITPPNHHTYLIHAEVDAIARCAKLGLSTDGGTMYVTWFPCVECAKAIVMAGITRLVYGSRDRWDNPRFNFPAAEEILLDAGVELVEYQD